MVANSWWSLIFGFPAIIMAWVIICWTPRSKKQWYAAAGMLAYVGLYYLIFVRGH